MPGVPLPRLLSAKEEEELTWARFFVAEAAERAKRTERQKDDDEDMFCEEVVDLSRQIVKRLEAKQLKLLEKKEKKEKKEKEMEKNIYLQAASSEEEEEAAWNARKPA